VNVSKISKELFGFFKKSRFFQDFLNKFYFSEILLLGNSTLNTFYLGNHGGFPEKSLLLQNFSGLTTIGSIALHRLLNVYCTINSFKQPVADLQRSKRSSAWGPLGSR